jgi:hypothetical protein
MYNARGQCTGNTDVQINVKHTRPASATRLTATHAQHADTRLQSTKIQDTLHLLTTVTIWQTNENKTSLAASPNSLQLDVLQYETFAATRAKQQPNPTPQTLPKQGKTLHNINLRHLLHGHTTRGCNAADSRAASKYNA